MRGRRVAASLSPLESAQDAACGPFEPELGASSDQNPRALGFLLLLLLLSVVGRLRRSDQKADVDERATDTDQAGRSGPARPRPQGFAWGPTMCVYLFLGVTHQNWGPKSAVGRGRIESTPLVVGRSERLDQRQCGFLLLATG